MAAALKPHGCHASRAWFRVVRQLSVAGMQRRNRNRPFFSFFSSPPSIFFPPFCSSFFGTQNPFFSPPFFSSHPFASAVLFLTLLSSLYYFWMARSCEESPLSKVESHWCWIAERKGGRLEEGGDRGKPERDMPRVSPCIILREKAKATAGCVTFAALPMGAQKRPFHRRNTRNNTVETAVN